MSQKFDGKFAFTVDKEGDGIHGWFGQLEIPTEDSDDASFELFSVNSRNETAPFLEIGSHAKYAVRGWANACRPVTLLEPFYNYSGRGEWSVGYRHSARLRGFVSTIVHDEHIDETQQCITEVGFCSDAFNAIGARQKSKENAEMAGAGAFETSVLKSSIDIEGMGTLDLSIYYKAGQSGEEVFSRVYTRLRNPQGIYIWDAIQWSRLHLAVVDFLAGNSAGNYDIGLRAGKDRDSALRLGTYKRTKKDHFGMIACRIDDPAARLPEILRIVSASPELTQQIFALTTLRSAKLGLIEQFTRAVSFVEKMLRTRYESEDVQRKKDEYIAGIERYNSHMRASPQDISNFGEMFAAPRYPTELTLKDLFRKGVEECRELGLTVEDEYEKKLIGLRNEISHGEEKGGSDWITDVLIGKEVAIAILELLTVKDIGISIPDDFKPRTDTLAFQRGLFR